MKNVTILIGLCLVLSTALFGWEDLGSMADAREITQSQSQPKLTEADLLNCEIQMQEVALAVFNDVRERNNCPSRYVGTPARVLVFRRDIMVHAAAQTEDSIKGDIASENYTELLIDYLNLCDAYNSSSVTKQQLGEKFKVFFAQWGDGYEFEYVLPNFFSSKKVSVRQPSLRGTSAIRHP